MYVHFKNLWLILMEYSRYVEIIFTQRFYDNISEEKSGAGSSKSKGVFGL